MIDIVAWFEAHRPARMAWNHHPAVNGLEVYRSMTDIVPLGAWLREELGDEADIDGAVAVIEADYALDGLTDPHEVRDEVRSMEPYEPKGYL